MKKRMVICITGITLMLSLTACGLGGKEKVISVSDPHPAVSEQKTDTGNDTFSNDTSQAKEDAMQELPEEEEVETKAEETEEETGDEGLSYDITLINKGFYLVTENGSDDNGGYIVANEYAVEKDANGNEKFKDSEKIYIADNQLLNAIIILCKGKTDMFLKPTLETNEAGIMIMTDYEFVDGAGKSLGKIDSVLGTPDNASDGVPESEAKEE